MATSVLVNERILIPGDSDPRPPGENEIYHVNDSGLEGRDLEGLELGGGGE